MDNIKEIPVDDLSKLIDIVQEYLPGTTEDELKSWYYNNHNLFAGYYLDDNLIGVCFGKQKGKTEIQLSGIAVIHPYNKQGRGSKLIKYFENVVKTTKYEKISLGSADGYVEHFYLKNGYKAMSLKILTDNDAWQNKTHAMYPVSRVETQEGCTKLVIEDIDYETADKKQICEFYNGCDCFYVFEKSI